MENEAPLPSHLRRVAELLGEAKTNHEIADELTVTLHTSEKYVSELKRLLQARDRVDLVMRCQELGSGLP
jgi:DNA-binding NarL/FixJ family response regulator